MVNSSSYLTSVLFSFIQLLILVFIRFIWLKLLILSYSQVQIVQTYDSFLQNQLTCWRLYTESLLLGQKVNLASLRSFNLVKKWSSFSYKELWGYGTSLYKYARIFLPKMQDLLLSQRTLLILSLRNLCYKMAGGQRAFLTYLVIEHLQQTNEETRRAFAERYE